MGSPVYENLHDSWTVLQSTSVACSSKYFLSFVDHTIKKKKKKAIFEVKICKIIEKRSGNLLGFLSLLSLSLILIYCTSCGKYSRKEILGAVRSREWGWLGRVERKGIPSVLGGTVCACLCRHFGLEHCCGWWFLPAFFFSKVHFPVTTVLLLGLFLTFAWFGLMSCACNSIVPNTEVMLIM